MITRQLLKLCHVVIIITLVIVSTSAIQAQSEQDIINKARVLGFIEAAYSRGDVSAVDSLYAEDFTYHPGGFDKEFLLVSILSLRGALPDLQALPLISVADDNWVAVHMRLGGTFTNDLILPGSTPLLPTNEPLRFVINMVFHLNDEGKVYEQWVMFDNLNYLAQLNLIDMAPDLWVGSLEPVQIIPSEQTELQEQAVIGYLDAFNSKDTSVFQQVLAENFTGYNPFGNFDKAGQVSDLSALLGAFPDMTTTPTKILIEGNYGAALYNMSGTFTGDYVLPDLVVPANQLELDLIRIDFFQFADNAQIVETREIYDGLDFMAQLGLLTPQQAP